MARQGPRLPYSIPKPQSKQQQQQPVGMPGEIQPRPRQPGPVSTYTVNPKGSPVRIPRHRTVSIRSCRLLDTCNVSELKIPAA